MEAEKQSEKENFTPKKSLFKKLVFYIEEKRKEVGDLLKVTQLTCSFNQIPLDAGVTAEHSGESDN